jgi:hypothetical protein
LANAMMLFETPDLSDSDEVFGEEDLCDDTPPSDD